MAACSLSTMILYVDADACPVKEEVVRVADRHALAVAFVSNAYMRLPEGRDVQRVIVGDGPDAADDWIAEAVTSADIVVTQDILLADRVLKAGAQAIGPTGKAFDATNIGLALAVRDIRQHLRETGEGGSHNPQFTKRDRSRFLEALEHAVQKAQRGRANRSEGGVR